MLHSVKAALPGYFRNCSSVFGAYTLHSLCKHECKYAQILRRCLSFKSASVCLCVCMPKYGWFSKSFGAVMLTKTRRDATRPFPHNATKRFKFLLPCFYLYFYGNSLKYLLRHKHARYYAYKCVCSYVCVCGGVCVCVFELAGVHNSCAKQFNKKLICLAF